MWFLGVVRSKIQERLKKGYLEMTGMADNKGVGVDKGYGPHHFWRSESFQS